MKTVEITCIGCGKKHSIVSEDGHTGIWKCDCGATTTVKGDASAVLDQVAKMMKEAPALLREFKQARRKGFETGLDEGLHEVCKDMVIEIVKEDKELLESLKAYVRDCLNQALHPQGEDESDGPPPRG